MKPTMKFMSASLMAVVLILPIASTVKASTSQMRVYLALLDYNVATA